MFICGGLTTLHCSGYVAKVMDSFPDEVSLYCVREGLAHVHDSSRRSPPLGRASVGQLASDTQNKYLYFQCVEDTECTLCCSRFYGIRCFDMAFFINCCTPTTTTKDTPKTPPRHPQDTYKMDMISCRNGSPLETSWTRLGRAAAVRVSLLRSSFLQFICLICISPRP